MSRISITASTAAGSATDTTVQGRAAHATRFTGPPNPPRLQPRSVPGPDALHLECRRAVEGA